MSPPVKHEKIRKPRPTAWKPGHSGNPAGRPRAGNTVAEVMRDYLDEPSGKSIDRKRKLVESVYDLAIRGNVAAVKLIVEIVGDLALEERVAALEARISGGTHGT